MPGTLDDPSWEPNPLMWRNLGLAWNVLNEELFFHPGSDVRATVGVPGVIPGISPYQVACFGYDYSQILSGILVHRRYMDWTVLGGCAQ